MMIRKLHALGSLGTAIASLVVWAAVQGTVQAQSTPTAVVKTPNATVYTNAQGTTTVVKPAGVIVYTPTPAPIPAQAPIKGAARKGEGTGRCEDGVMRITSAGNKDSNYASLSCDRIEVVVSGQGRVQIAAISARTVALRTSGAGEITVGLLTADALHARSGGDGPTVIRDGHVTSTKLVLSGSGEFDAQGLVSDSAEVTHSASSAARVNVTRSLTGSLSGSGELRHTGGAIVRVSNSGSGRIAGL
jgi:hypothetical protein